MLDLEQHLQTLSAPYVVMAVGLPGSGKTTELEAVAERLRVARISPDEIRQELTGSETDQTRNNEVWAETHRRVELRMKLSESAIVDATYARGEQRRADARLYRSFGATAVVAAVFDMSLELAKQRNADRKRVVPDHVLERMARSLAEVPVSIADGFDEIIIVET